MSTITRQLHITKLQTKTIALIGILSITAAATAVMMTMPLNIALIVIAIIVSAMTLYVLPERRRIILALLIFVVPLNIDINLVEQPSPGGADGLSLGLVELFLTLLLILTIVRSVRAKQIGVLQVFPALLLPSMAMLFFFILSMVNSTDLLWSTFDIINFAKVILIYLLVANNVRNESDMRIVLLALFAGLLVQVFIATAVNMNPAMNDLFLKVKFGVAGEIQNAKVIRSGGSLGNPNHFGRYLGLILPSAFVIVLTRQNRLLTVFAVLAAMAGTLAVINTLSRSAWIGLAISVLVMLPLMLKYRLVSFRTLWLLGVISLCVGVVLFFYGDVIWQRLTEDDHGSAMTRITTAKVAWAIIKDHPFFGCGINNYGAMLADYWIGEDTFTNKAAVHNNYLLYMAEIGIVGFTSVIWWLAAFGARIVRAMKSHSRFYAALAVSFMGAYAGMLLESLSDKSYKENFSLLLILWTIMALTEAIIRNGEDHDHRTIAA